VIARGRARSLPFLRRPVLPSRATSRASRPHGNARMPYCESNSYSCTHTASPRRPTAETPPDARATRVRDMGSAGGREVQAASALALSHKARIACERATAAHTTRRLPASYFHSSQLRHMPTGHALRAPPDSPCAPRARLRSNADFGCGGTVATSSTPHVLPINRIQASRLVVDACRTTSIRAYARARDSAHGESCVCRHRLIRRQWRSEPWERLPSRHCQSCAQRHAAPPPRT